MGIGKIKKIFIVDDDEMLSTALEDYLTREIPHKVQVFNTGEDCLRQLRHDEPDIVILDYFLNTVSKEAANGIEILQSIKKNYPHIHVIMLSGQEKYGVTLQSIQKGAEQYVMKDENAFEEIGRMIRDM